jgi:hypothetical protein
MLKVILSQTAAWVTFCLGLTLLLLGHVAWASIGFLATIASQFYTVYCAAMAIMLRRRVKLG